MRKGLSAALLVLTARELSQGLVPHSRNNLPRNPITQLSIFSPNNNEPVPFDVDDRAAQKAYEEWIKTYKKAYNARRLRVFTDNYKVITSFNIEAIKKAKEEGTDNPFLLTFSEYADLTAEEYEEAMREELGNSSGEFTPMNASNTDRVRSAYLSWCEAYGKEPVKERFPQFSANFLAMEEATRGSGKIMLNEYADCTEDEYTRLLRSSTGPGLTSFFENIGPKTPKKKPPKKSSPSKNPFSDAVSGIASFFQVKEEEKQYRPPDPPTISRFGEKPKPAKPFFAGGSTSDELGYKAKQDGNADDSREKLKRESIESAAAAAKAQADMRSQLEREAQAARDAAQRAREKAANVKQKATETQRLAIDRAAKEKETAQINSQAEAKAAAERLDKVRREAEEKATRERGKARDNAKSDAKIAKDQVEEERRRMEEMDRWREEAIEREASERNNLREDELRRKQAGLENTARRLAREREENRRQKEQEAKRKRGNIFGNSQQKNTFQRPSDDETSAGMPTFMLNSNFRGISIPGLSAAFRKKEDDPVRKAYRDWCQYYGNFEDEGRFKFFSANVKFMEKSQKGKGKLIKLNQFADRDPVEFIELKDRTDTNSYLNGRGATSFRNPNGARGATSFSGNRGATSFRNPTGGSGATSFRNSNGNRGATSFRTPNGSKGATSFRRPTGGRGAASFRSTNGDKRGATSFRNPFGANDTNGDNRGATSFRNPFGSNRTNGDKRGATSFRNSFGANGTNGANGVNKANGVNGFNKPNGVNGFNKANGASGASGSGGVSPYNPAGGRKAAANAGLKAWEERQRKMGPKLQPGTPDNFKESSDENGRRSGLSSMGDRRARTNGASSFGTNGAARGTNGTSSYGKRGASNSFNGGNKSNKKPKGVPSFGPNGVSFPGTNGSKNSRTNGASNTSFRDNNSASRGTSRMKKSGSFGAQSSMGSGSGTESFYSRGSLNRNKPKKSPPSIAYSFLGLGGNDKDKKNKQSNRSGGFPKPNSNNSRGRQGTGRENASTNSGPFNNVFGGGEKSKTRNSNPLFGNDSVKGRQSPKKPLSSQSVSAGTGSQLPRSSTRSDRPRSSSAMPPMAPNINAGTGAKLPSQQNQDDFAESLSQTSGLPTFSLGADFRENNGSKKWTQGLGLGKNKKDPIRNAYSEWCRYYKKEEDDNRYFTFSKNLLQVENYQGRGIRPIRLNEYSDLTPNEFEALQRFRGRGEGGQRLPRSTIPPAPQGIPSRKASSQMPKSSLRTPLRPKSTMKRNQKPNPLFSFFGGEQKKSATDFTPPQQRSLSRSQNQARFDRPASSSPPNRFTPSDSKIPTLDLGNLFGGSKTPPGFAKNPGNFKFKNRNEEDRAKKVYIQWCNYYRKRADENRFRIFAANMMEVESSSKKGRRAQGVEDVELNELSDLTVDEFRKAQIQAKSVMEMRTPTSSGSNSFRNKGIGSTSFRGRSRTTTLDTPSRGSSSSGSSIRNSVMGTKKNSMEERTRIRKTYNEWCIYYGKEPTLDRLNTFTKNFGEVERLYKQTGKAVDMNEFMDLTPSEYKKARNEKKGFFGM